MNYYLYIMQHGGDRYIGVTKNIENRLKQHNSGQNKSTKHIKGWRVVYFRKYDTLGEARIEENILKRKGSKILLHRGVAQPG